MNNVNKKAKLGLLAFTLFVMNAVFVGISVADNPDPGEPPCDFQGP